MRVRYMLIIFFGLFLSSCAATQTQQSLLSQLQLRVSDLERQVDTKDEEIQDLKYELKDLSYQLDRLDRPNTPRVKDRKISRAASREPEIIEEKDDRIIRVDISARRIQRALKNAGYYNGKIDNKIGKQSKLAIAEFQKDHGLKSDGIIGKKTWRELKDYLD